MKTQDKKQQASHTPEIESRILEIMERELTAYLSYEGIAYIDEDSTKGAVNAIVEFLQPMINDLSDLKAHANEGVIVTMEQLNGFTETAKKRDKLKGALADVTKERDKLVEVFAAKEKRIEQLLVKVEGLKAANGEITEARFDAVRAFETANRERYELKVFNVDLVADMKKIAEHVNNEFQTKDEGVPAEIQEVYSILAKYTSNE